MNINQIIFNHYNKASEHKREKGVFWATDINKIKRGDLTPENFYSSQRDYDWQAIGNIFTGCAYEAELAKILEEEKVNCTFHEKKDLEIAPGIIIRSQLDVMFVPAIVECKAPTKMRPHIPDWYKDQAEIYYRTWNKDVYFYMFVPRELVFEYRKLIVEFKYKPSALRWKNIQKTLINFDKQI